MTDKEIEKEIRAEIRRSKRANARKRSFPRRLTALLLVAALVLGGLAFAAHRGVDGLDELRRLFTYKKPAAGADGREERFRYDNDRTAEFSALGGGLLIVSTTRILLLNERGEEAYSRTVSFKNPAIARGAQTAAAYDVGGKELYLFNARGLLRDMSEACNNGVLAVSLNASDYLALTTLKSGCRAAVSAYDASGAPVFAYHSSERYVSDARVLDDCRHLAAVTLGEADGVFASTLSFYSFDSETAVSTTTLSGSTVYVLGGFGGAAAAVEDGRLTLFGADGSLAGSYRYEYPYLRGQTFGADFAALLLSRYRSGSSLRLVTVNAEGNALGTLDVQHEVLDVSAAGKYVAVLFTDSLKVYGADLTEYASLSGTEYARRVFMRPDGSALLIGASRAWLYAP